MSTTVGSRLKELTGLSGASVAQNLRAISSTGGTVGAILMAFSGLSSATFAEHLLANRAIVQPPIEVAAPVGSAGAGSRWRAGRDQAEQMDAEDMEVVILVATLTNLGLICR